MMNAANHGQIVGKRHIFVACPVSNAAVESLRGPLLEMPNYSRSLLDNVKQFKNRTIHCMIDVGVSYISGYLMNIS